MCVQCGLFNVYCVLHSKTQGSDWWEHVVLWIFEDNIWLFSFRIHQVTFDGLSLEPDLVLGCYTHSQTGCK